LGICVARLSDPAIKKPLEIEAFLMDYFEENR
jgi:hypothetical protein